MGRQQFYKGNPELKQYFLVNDFSGGINTTDVDERTSDNEFRELLNIELIRAGMIQNRKGWGLTRLLNELMASPSNSTGVSVVSLPTFQLNGQTVNVNQYALIQIVKNTGNILPLIEEYDEKNVSLAQFKSYGFNYDLEILMIYSDNVGIKLGLLSLSSSNANGKNGFSVIATLATNTTLSEDRPLTNIETVSFSDKIYFSLSQLKPGLVGLGEYDIDDKTFRFVRDDELPDAFVYKPNPYEATKIGFNVLSQNPLTDVATVSTFFSLTGVFLTQYKLNSNNQLVDTETPIQSIPLNGKFTVNILYTGQNIDVDDFKVEFFVFKTNEDGIQEEFLLPYTVDALKQETTTGVLRLAVTVDIKGYNEINLRILGSNGTLFSQTYVRSFVDTDAMVDYFNPDTNTKFVLFNENKYSIFNKTSGVYNYERIETVTTEGKTFNIIDDDVYTTTTLRKWEDATATDFNNQTNTNLKTTHRTTGDCDQDIYDEINTTTLNGPTPFLPVTQYSVGHVAEIRLSRVQETITPENFFWTATTTTSPINSTQEVTPSQFDEFQISSLPALPNASFPAGHLRRVIAYTTTQVPIYETQTTTGTWSRTFIFNQSQVVGNYPIQYSDPGPFGSVTRKTDSQIIAEITSAFGTNYSAGALITVEEFYIRTFDNVKVVLENKIFRFSGNTTSQVIVGYNTVPSVYGTKFYIVNYQAGGSNPNIVDCSPLQVKYFKLVQQNLGEAVTYNKSTEKITYRLGTDTPVDLFSNVVLINSINDVRPAFGSRYLIGSDPTDQEAYWRYNGGTAGTIADFTNIDFVDAVRDIEYIDTYLIQEPVLKKIEPLDITGFRIFEAWNRLVYYKENIIWFSDLYQFDYIPNYNYVILPLSPNDKITNISYFKGSYIIFTKEKIYKMSGTFGAADFQIQIINDSIGCISPFSVRGFNNTLVFMTHDGLYRIKQNYYQNGLENVEKIDKQIDGIIPYNTEVYSLLYNEQYLLIYDYAEGIPDSGFNVLKVYYNMSAPNGYPYVKDKYSIVPTVIGQFDDGLYSIKYGKFYKYDKGYTDFLPPNETIETLEHPSLYTTRIRTHKLSFNYPTHEKKFKAILIKDIANEPVPLLFDIYINNNRVYQHTQFEISINDLGEIVYQPVVTNPVVIGANNLLGNFELNKAQLGDLSARVHKIVFSGKGKDILLDIERRTAQQFSIQDIGYVYKMGKAREDR
jgi:hypothetical protein